MAKKNSRYRWRPCGYCGIATGQNEGEHVIPACLYPSTTPASLQRLKIPSCPSCNDGFSMDEAHFRSIVAACGMDPTPERRELWEAAVRSFREQRYGDVERQAMLRQLVASEILMPNGEPFQSIIPHKNDRFVRIVKKVVRGLVHSLDWKTTVMEQQVLVERFKPISEYDFLFSQYYVVPNVFNSYVATFKDPAFPEPVREQLHSCWHLGFGNIGVTAIVHTIVGAEKQDITSVHKPDENE